ncbi:MAG: ABC-2 family transporter protein [Myxococcaceae bacterium]|jgi:ABC-2 type transport system permease protein|nr:ABC-2 family transporter protein [Myxococcaceae bacterium]
MRRALELFLVQLRASVMLAAQYRLDFVLDLVIGSFWTVAAVLPLFVVYGGPSKAGVPGWTFGETLLVVGCFITLQAVIDGAISPSLTSVLDHVRKGTLDFVLLKPHDSQLLVSTSRFQPWRVAGLVHASVVFGLGFSKLGHGPSLLGVAEALLLLAVSTLMLYSLWLLIVSVSFFAVKVDNLSSLFTSIFDAARWPASVFRGGFRFVFTFVIPLVVMTTFPAEALLGRLPPLTLLASVGGALLFALAARLVWLASLSRYTSAGG